MQINPLQVRMAGPGIFQPSIDDLLNHYTLRFITDHAVEAILGEEDIRSHHLFNHQNDMPDISQGTEWRGPYQELSSNNIKNPHNTDRGKWNGQVR